MVEILKLFTKCQADYIWPLTSIIAGTKLSSHWNRCSGYICLPCPQCLCKNHRCGLTECFIHHLGIPPSIASQQGTHFIANEVWQWAHVRGFTGLAMFPITQRQLIWQNDELATWIINYNTKWMTVACRARVIFPRTWSTLWISNQSMNFAHISDSHVWESKNRNGSNSPLSVLIIH